MRPVKSIPHSVKNLDLYPNVMWAKEYKVSATRVGLQKIAKKRDNSNNSTYVHDSKCLQLLSKNVKEQHVEKKAHFFSIFAKPNAFLHAFFCRDDHGGSCCAIVVIAIDHGVLTLGESLFAYVACSFVY
jgi:uncharacterized protein with NRDE domain